MVAAPQSLLAQIVGDLVRARGQLGEGKLGLLARRHVDDPERAAVPAVGGARQLRIEPFERPVERHRLRPLKPGHGLVVVGPVGQQELAGLLKRRHERSPLMVRGSTRALLLAPFYSRTGDPSSDKPASVGKRTGSSSRRPPAWRPSPGIFSTGAMNSAVIFRSPARRLASLSQRVARIEAPALSRRSQPQRI